MVFRWFLLTLWSCVVYGTIQQKIPNRNITMSVTMCLGKNVMMWVRTIQMSLYLHGGVMCWKLNSFMFCAVTLMAWVKCMIASLLCGVHIPSLFCSAIFAPQKNDNHQFFCSVAIAPYKIYYSPMVSCDTVHWIEEEWRQNTIFDEPTHSRWNNICLSFIC